MKTAINNILILFVLIQPLNTLSQQCIYAGPDQNSCPGQPVTLTATLYGNSSPAQYVGTQVFLTDDQFSGVINIGFPFTFYGNTYTQCLISSNNYICFNTAFANGFSPWSITAPVPGNPNNQIRNAVLGPWQDINPGIGGQIFYATIGTAPNRAFVVQYNNVPMFSCTSLQYCSQIILYEGTNIAETHIGNKPICPGWNGGQAIHATNNALGTVADVVPGRNSGTQWATANEGRRFTPNGANYIISNIPYSPAPIQLNTPPTIQWFELPSNTLVGTGLSITVNPMVTTTYEVRVSGTACTGGACTDQVTVFVGTGVINVSPNTSICDGQSTVLTANSPTITTFNWSPATGLSATTGASVTANPTTTTTYTVSGTDPSGCSATASVTVTVNPNPNVAVNPALSDICVGQNVQLTASGALNYTWSPAVGLSSTTGATVTASPPNNTTYTVVGTDANGCIATATADVNILPNLNATITPAGPFCTSDASVFLTAVDPGGTWSGPGVNPITGEFTPALAGAGNHTITYTISGPCGDQQSTQIQVTADAITTITPVGPFCENASAVNLTAVDPGGTWSGPGVNPVTGAFNPAQAGVGTHTITYTINGFCGSSSSTDITVNPLPVINPIADITAGCMPLTVNFSSTSNPAGTDCLWQLSDGTTHTNCSGFTHTFSQPGTYTVFYQSTTAAGCISNTTLVNYITVYDLPVPEFIHSPTNATVSYPTINFTNLSTGANNYLWDFAGLGNSTDVNPQFVFPNINPGTYSVCLTAFGQGNCPATVCHDVVIASDFICYVPNSFSPNNDGLNDIFIPVMGGHVETEYEFYVYNRWGELIFQTRSVNEGWDGTFKQLKCPNDVYVWKVRAVAEFDGEYKEKTGHVTLIR
jgi:gliding motility-associated-like protein